MFVVLSSEHFSQFPLQIVFFKKNLEVIHIDICKNHWIAHVHIRGMHNVQHIHEGTLYGGGGTMAWFVEVKSFYYNLAFKAVPKPRCKPVYSIISRCHTWEWDKCYDMSAIRKSHAHPQISQDAATKYSHLSINQFHANPMFLVPHEMPRVATQPFDVPPQTKGAKHSAVPSEFQACWWMPSTFDTEHTITSLKYGHAREML